MTENTYDSSRVYRTMWEEFGTGRDDSYFAYKFAPRHRVGLTNFLREERIVDFTAARATDVILDVGCSAGRQVFVLAGLAREVHGVDVARSFVDTANRTKERLGVCNAHFAQALVEHLPYADGRFDKVICGEVIEHVLDEDKALEELLRVLKPDGTLIISVPNLNADGTVWGRLMRKIGVRSFTPIEVFSIDEIARHGDAHVREFTTETLVRWLESRQLTVDRLTTVSFIDGPGFDFLLKIPLHVGPLRRLIVSIERLLSRTGWPLGRHIVVCAHKNNAAR